MLAPSAFPNLQQLLRLSFSEPVLWLAGGTQDNIQIAWVSVTLKDMRPGDLLLLAAGQVTSDALSAARGGGAAAVLIIGPEAPPPDLPPDPLPVVFLKSLYELRDAQQALLTILVNQRAALMERGVRVHTQLSQLAAQGEGLESLAAAMSDLSSRGILVQDKRLVVLAHQPSPTLAGIWDDILVQLCEPDSLPEVLRDRKAAGRQAVIVTQTLPGGLARQIATISVGEVARGYLSQVGMEGELDALDQLVIEQGAMVCAVEMARAKAVREAEKRLKGDLLTALLQDDLSPRDAGLWVLAMGLDLEHAHVALRFAWDAAAPPSRRRLETLVNGEATRRGLKMIVNSMGSEVACICEVSTANNRPNTAIEFAEAVSSQGVQENQHIPIRCGIGRPALELSDWRQSFRQAGQALELARRFGEMKPLFYPDLSVYRLLLQIEPSPELSAFQEEILGGLLAHDNAEDLIRTLEAYFEHNGNLSQTAQALYIHRNTLMYRMSRIGSITGLNLEDPRARLAVQLALNIYRMMGSKRA